MDAILIFVTSIGTAYIVARLRRRGRFATGSIAILTWGGLRGGISVALALSTPPGPTRDTIVAMTYFVVVFSVFAQGLTLRRLAGRIARE